MKICVDDLTLLINLMHLATYQGKLYRVIYPLPTATHRFTKKIMITFQQEYTSTIHCSLTVTVLLKAPATYACTHTLRLLYCTRANRCYKIYKSEMVPKKIRLARMHLRCLQCRYVGITHDPCLN